MWTVRQARPEDVDALRRLCADAVGPDDYVPGYLERFVEGSATFLALDGARVVGMMVYDDVLDGSAWLHAARTHPDYRRRGVATALMQACENLGWTRRRQALRLWASASNVASVTANRRYGFQERARFTRMRAAASAYPRPVALEPARLDERDWRSIERSPILRKSAGYVFHDYYFLPLSRPNADLLAAAGALRTFGGNGVSVSEDLEGAQGGDLQVQALFGDLASILRAAPALAADRGADRVESFLPHDLPTLTAAQQAGFSFMEWGQEAILFEKILR